MQNHLYSTLSTGVALLVLRLFLAYEFFEAGLEKWRGQNWFADIQSQFPMPFSALPADINWQLATYTELVVPVLLVIGLLPRLSAGILIILTSVAWYAVHSDAGYNVCQNGYKMALMYIVMLIPILMQGSGLFSVQYWLQKKSSLPCWFKHL